MSEVTMLNGLPVTMLNGCDCQKQNLSGVPDSSGALVAGAALGLAYLLTTTATNKTKSLNGFAADAGKEVLARAVPWVVGIGAVYFLAVKPVLEKVGIIETSEDKQRNTASLTYGTSLQSPFSPNYYKSQGQYAKLITRASAEALAKRMYDADGYFNDDETQVYGALRTLQYKTQVSWVADVFNQKYKKDLYQFLKAFMDDAEMDVVHGIVNNLK